MAQPILLDHEFYTFQKLIFKEAGISLNDSKKALVQSRLYKRLSFYKLKSYADYLRLIQINSQERAEMINLLTSNETYFFRELKHFEYLQKNILSEFAYKDILRIWSAAASVGAEAYTVAMILDSYFGNSNWEVYGTDINSEVVKKARVGLYPESWVNKIPQEFRSKYCLKGKGQYSGKFLIDRILTKNMRFEQGNLLEPRTDIGKFHVVFLRNVLIYFDTKTKQRVVDNVLRHIVDGGYFIISHTENLNMIDTKNLQQVATSIYKKVR